MTGEGEKDSDGGTSADQGGDKGGGGDNPGETVIVSNVVLAFIHSWYQGNNNQEIVKLCLAS